MDRFTIGTAGQQLLISTLDICSLFQRPLRWFTPIFTLEVIAQQINELREVTTITGGLHQNADDFSSKDRSLHLDSRRVKHLCHPCRGGP